MIKQLEIKNKIEEMKNELKKNGSVKSHIFIIEKKTQKPKMSPIIHGLFSELEKYTRNMKLG